MVGMAGVMIVRSRADRNTERQSGSMSNAMAVAESFLVEFAEYVAIVGGSVVGTLSGSTSLADVSGLRVDLLSASTSRGRSFDAIAVTLLLLFNLRHGASRTLPGESTLSTASVLLSPATGVGMVS